MSDVLTVNFKHQILIMYDPVQLDVFQEPPHCVPIHGQSENFIPLSSIKAYKQRLNTGVRSVKTTTWAPYFDTSEPTERIMLKTPAQSHSSTNSMFLFLIFSLKKLGAYSQIRQTEITNSCGGWHRPIGRLPLVPCYKEVISLHLTSGWW